MTGRTHLLTGILGGLAISYLTHAATVPAVASITGAAALGSLLPDIDHPQSWISGYIPGTAWLLGGFGVRHRTFTHSLLALALLTGGWYFLTTQQHVSLPWIYLAALLTGMLSHNIADMLTAEGVQFLYPLPFMLRITPWNWSLFRFPLFYPIRWLLNTGLEFTVNSLAFLGIVAMLALILGFHAAA